MAELVLTPDEEAQVETVLAQLDPDHDELIADVRRVVAEEDWPVVRERVLASLRAELLSRLAGRAVRGFLADHGGVTVTEDEIRFIEDWIRTTFVYKCEAGTPGGIGIHPELERIMDIETRSGLPASTILSRILNLGQVAGTLMFADLDEELKQLTTDSR
jgi:hypothetical protein